jgi:hypothetical protein
MSVQVDTCHHAGPAQRVQTRAAIEHAVGRP